MADWDARFLNMAEFIAGWSKDPGTGVGCVIVRPDRTIASVGYNGFPRGVQDNGFRLGVREVKLAFTVHAEPNAVVAAREPLHGFTAYTWPFPPCASCAGLIVQSGIRRVVAPAPTPEQAERWGVSFGYARTIFYEGKVQLDVISCPECESEAEELRVVGPDHCNTADYANSDPSCSTCGASWPPAGTALN